MQKHPFHSVDIEKFKKLLYQEKKTNREIGKIFGVSRITIKTWRKKLNLPPRKKTQDLDRPFWTGKKRPEIGKLISKAHQGRFGMEKNPAWKGGKIYRTGYCEVKVFSRTPKKSGYIREHRLVMEKHLGRKLKNTEIVHHVDGNKLNNSIENLVITNRSKHASHHMFGNKFSQRSAKVS